MCLPKRATTWGCPYQIKNNKKTSAGAEVFLLAVGKCVALDGYRLAKDEGAVVVDEDAVAEVVVDGAGEDDFFEVAPFAG
jgi:hypothetical protein